jgi:nitrous oxidase accessory protein NosD
MTERSVGGGMDKEQRGRCFLYFHSTAQQSEPTYTYGGNFGVPFTGLGIESFLLSMNDEIQNSMNIYCNSKTIIVFFDLKLTYDRNGVASCSAVCTFHGR